MSRYFILLRGTSLQSVPSQVANPSKPLALVVVATGVAVLRFLKVYLQEFDAAWFFGLLFGLGPLLYVFQIISVDLGPRHLKDQILAS